MLKKLLLKFISNTQVKEIKDLSEAFSHMENEKRELETKNKKIQEFFNSLTKEKEEKDNKIQDLARELDRVRKLLVEKDRKIQDLENKARAHVCHGKEPKRKRLNSKINLFNKKLEHKKVLRTISANHKKYTLDYIERDSSEDSQKMMLAKNLAARNKRDPKVSLNNTVTNNYININLTTKVPTVTAVLQNTSQLGYYSTSKKDSLNSIKANEVKKKRDKSSSNTPKNQNRKISQLDKLVESQYFSKQNVKQSSVKSPLVSTKYMTNYKDFQFKSNSNDIPHPLYAMSKQQSNNMILNNYNSNNNNMLLQDIENDNRLNDSISVSAVTYNNEGCLNSSVLEMMENVLHLDGINNFSFNKLQTPVQQTTADTKTRQKTSSGKLLNRENIGYKQQYLNRIKGPMTREPSPKAKTLENGKENKRFNSVGNDSEIFQNALNAMKEKVEEQAENPDNSIKADLIDF